MGFQPTAVERLPTRRLVMTVVLSLMVALSGANAADAQRRTGLSFRLMAHPQSLRLCTRDSVDILVWLVRQVHQGRGRAPAETLAHGGQIEGDVRDENVGRFVPGEGLRAVRGTPEPRAVYEFVAAAPGRTTIDFIIVTTGDPYLGNRRPSHVESIAVEVTDCFEAYTSGLGMVFPVNDMKDLIQPFVLEAFSERTANGVSISTSSQSFFFMPGGNRRNRIDPSFTGRYVFGISEITRAGNLQSECQIVASGRYDTNFRILPDDPRYRSGVDVGDLLLSGGASRYCQGRLVQTETFADTPTGDRRFRVAFKTR